MNCISVAVDIGWLGVIGGIGWLLSIGIVESNRHKVSPMQTQLFSIIDVFVIGRPLHCYQHNTGRILKMGSGHSFLVSNPSNFNL